jgi:release factor glutamine methyltransferase
MAWTSYGMAAILPGTLPNNGGVFLDDAVLALRAAGCVHAEDEAALIWETYDDPSVRASAVADRAGGRPLEQVVGWAGFGQVRVALAPGVFVPRRRAESLLAPAVELKPDARIVVDLGCGAGALAASLAVLLPRADVHGVDLDETALACARRTGGFTVHRGSWWSGLPAGLAGRVDLAVAYLPHVPTSRLDRIHPDFRAHEPDLAVDGGTDGLDPLRAVLGDADQWLAPEGAFVTLLSLEQAAGLDLEVLTADEDDAVVAWRHGAISG